jgi:hypothetical protein
MAKAFGSRKVRGGENQPGSVARKKGGCNTAENDESAPYAFILHSLHQFVPGRLRVLVHIGAGTADTFVFLPHCGRPPV